MPRRRTHAVGYVFNVAPLLLLSGEQFLSAFTRPQLEALAYASLGVSGKLVELLTSIWGLWLFPFAVLTIKSNSLPKFLGVLLILSGVAYVLSFLVAVPIPGPARHAQHVCLPALLR